MKKPIIVFGNSDFSELLSYYLLAEYEIAAYCVNEEYIENSTFLDKPLVSFEKLSQQFPNNKYDMIIAIGYNHMNTVREKIFKQVKELGYKLISYIHPSNLISPSCHIGENCIILENNIIQPYVRIGDNVIIWSGSTICHESTIDDHVFIASNVCINGKVTIKDHCFVGASATIRDNINISSFSLIGCGCTILHNSEPYSVYKSNNYQIINISSLDIII